MKNKMKKEMKNLIRKILRESENDWGWADESLYNVNTEILKADDLSVGGHYKYIKDEDPTTKSNWRGEVIKSDIEGIPDRRVGMNKMVAPKWVDSLEGREFQVLVIGNDWGDHSEVVIKWSDTSETESYLKSSNFFEWGRFEQMG